MSLRRPTPAMIRAAASMCTIDHQETGARVTFVLNDEQRRIVDFLCAPGDRKAIVKPRQVGCSTVIALWWAVFLKINPGAYLPVVVDDKTKGKDFLELIKRFAGELGLDTKKNDDSKESKTFANESSIASETPRAPSSGEDKQSRVGRSGTGFGVWGSEVAFWENDAKTISTLTSALVFGAPVVFESTGSAGMTVFRAICEGQLKKWETLFFSVEDHAAYSTSPDVITDDVWEELKQKYSFRSRPHAAWWYERLWQDKNGDEFEMLREYPVLKTHPFIAAAGQWIRSYTPANTNMDEVSDRNDGKWEVYREDATSEGKVVVSVDPAAGVSGDGLAILVRDIESGHILRTFWCNKTDIEAGMDLMIKTADLYGMRVDSIIVENNGVGASYAQHAGKSRYSCYQQRSSDDRGNRGTGEKHTRMIFTRNSIEGGLRIGAQLQLEIKSSRIVNGKYEGRDDLINALSFSEMYMRNNPVARAPEYLDDRKVLVLEKFLSKKGRYRRSRHA